VEELRARSWLWERGDASWGCLYRGWPRLLLFKEAGGVDVVPMKLRRGGEGRVSMLNGVAGTKRMDDCAWAAANAHHKVHADKNGQVSSTMRRHTDTHGLVLWPGDFPSSTRKPPAIHAHPCPCTKMGAWTQQARFLLQETQEELPVHPWVSPNPHL